MTNISFETNKYGIVCAKCGRAQIAHHPALRFCKSKDGLRWRKSKFMAAIKKNEVNS